MNMLRRVPQDHSWSEQVYATLCRPMCFPLYPIDYGRSDSIVGIKVLARSRQRVAGILHHDMLAVWCLYLHETHALILPYRCLGALSLLAHSSASASLCAHALPGSLWSRLLAPYTARTYSNRSPQV